MWKTRSGGKWAASLGAGAVLPDGAQPGPQLCSQCEISYTGAAALVQQRQGAPSGAGAQRARVWKTCLGDECEPPAVVASHWECSSGAAVLATGG